MTHSVDFCFHRSLFLSARQGLTPREVEIRGVYFPPLFLSVLLGGFVAWLTCLFLHRYRHSRMLEAPTVVFLALTAIYAVIFSTVLFPS